MGILVQEWINLRRVLGGLGLVKLDKGKVGVRKQ